MKRTRIVPNGKPGVYEMERSPLEVGLYVSAFGVIVAFLAWLAIGQIALGRELASKSGESGDVKKIRSDLDSFIQSTNDERKNLLTIQAFEHAMAPRDAERQAAIARLDILIDGQMHNRYLLEKWPPVKERKR